MKMKKVLIISGVALGIGASLYMINYLIKSQKKQKSKKLSRTKVMRILKEQKMNFSKVFNACASMASQIRSENPCSEHSELRKCLLSDELPIVKEIENFEKGIYEKYRVTQQQFQNACQVTYKDDNKIQNLMREMKEEFENSLKGIPPTNMSSISNKSQISQPSTQMNSGRSDLRETINRLPRQDLSNIEIPAILTRQKSIRIMKDIQQGCLCKIKQKVRNLKKNFDQERPPTQQEIFEQMTALKLDHIQQKVLAKNGLDKFGVPAFSLYQAALMKYSTDPTFKIQVQLLQDQQQQEIQSLFLSKAQQQKLQQMQQRDNLWKLQEQQMMQTKK